MLPDGTYRITSLGTSGDGLAETEDGPLYVPGALPGDCVDVRNGKVTISAMANGLERRISPLCSHVARCGGCAVQHIADDLYGRWKHKLVTQAFAQHGIDDPIAPTVTVARNSRRRAIFTVKRDGRSIALGFHERQSHHLETIADCAIIGKTIQEGLPAIREIAALVMTSKSETHVTVIDTPQGLDVTFAEGRTSLPADQRRAVSHATLSHPIARLTVANEPTVLKLMPELSIAGVRVTPPPAAFLQASVEAEIAMQQLAATATTKAKYIADLFSGLGTFTFAVAKRARVLSIDSDRALINALGDAARKTQGLKQIETKVRDLFLDPLSPRELDQFDAVIFDPPRPGAKAQSEAIAKSKVKTVIAVSCNPATLGRDLRILVDAGFRIDQITPIDQFLYTSHMEAVAVLRRR